VLEGHTNEKNFVGLSVNSGDGLIACGSETNEAGHEQILLATSSDTIFHKKRGFKMRRMTWLSIFMRPILLATSWDAI
jgi:hypothetical protein